MEIIRKISKRLKEKNLFIVDETKKEMLKTIKFRIFARFFTFISIISYSMYLINYTIVLKILMPFSLSALGLLDGSKLPAILVSYFLFWTFVIGGSYLLYTCFERPVMNLRDRINFK